MNKCICSFTPLCIITNRHLCILFYQVMIQFFYNAFTNIIITIYPENVSTSCFFYSSVSNLGDSMILLMYYCYSIVCFCVFITYFTTSICRTIINQYHLQIVIGLFLNRFNTCRKVFFYIVNGNDDTHQFIFYLHLLKSSAYAFWYSLYSACLCIN